MSDQITISSEEAASLLGIKARTLAKYRAVGGGPKYIQIGRLVRYRVADLIAWAESLTVSNTAEGKRKRAA